MIEALEKPLGFVPVVMGAFFAIEYLQLTGDFAGHRRQLRPHPGGHCDLLGLLQRRWTLLRPAAPFGQDLHPADGRMAGQGDQGCFSFPRCGYGSGSLGHRDRSDPGRPGPVRCRRRPGCAGPVQELDRRDPGAGRAALSARRLDQGGWPRRGYGGDHRLPFHPNSPFRSGTGLCPQQQAFRFAGDELQRHDPSAHLLDDRCGVSDDGTAAASDPRRDRGLHPGERRFHAAGKGLDLRSGGPLQRFLHRHHDLLLHQDQSLGPMAGDQGGLCLPPEGNRRRRRYRLRFSQPIGLCRKPARRGA